MNAPGQFHFLKVPNNEDDETSPSCGDGTEFSFQFKRGTDANLKKVVVEFGGGLICHDAITCGYLFGTGHNHLRTPWYDGFPSHPSISLSSCSGFATPILQKVTLDSLEKNGLTEEDILFGARTGKYSYVNNDDGVDKEKHRNPKKWRQLLNEAAESWSYIYVPQCTADAHLGAQPDPINYQRGKNILHRGGYNLLAI
eukprot:3923892-Ditylum_brightwellii.AAC.1